MGQSVSHVQDRKDECRKRHHVQCEKELIAATTDGFRRRQRHEYHRPASQHPEKVALTPSTSASIITEKERVGAIDEIHADKVNNHIDDRAAADDAVVLDAALK